MTVPYNKDCCIWSCIWGSPYLVKLAHMRLPAKSGSRPNRLSQTRSALCCGTLPCLTGTQGGPAAARSDLDAAVKVRDFLPRPNWGRHARINNGVVLGIMEKKMETTVVYWDYIGGIWE